MKVAFKRADGGVSITEVTDMDMGRVEFEKWKTSAVIANPEWLPATVETISNLPSDKEFRDAWEHVNGDVVENLSKAAGIQAIRISEAKAAKEKELLVREAGGEDVTAEKAQVQAVDPLSVRNAKNIDELKSSLPTALKRS
ncbi:MAG: hypothetical protein GEU76_03865 [Alphaproteobacteria bacterium]|nr:hypothetical protein [Alphaproteobacteria bacterium]